MSRYRLVISQNNGATNVSSLLLGEHEVEKHLDLETSMHQLAGWTVTRGDGTVVCRRGTVTRVVSVRVSHAMDDTL
jgi:hypothetical protein